MREPGSKELKDNLFTAIGRTFPDVEREKSFDFLRPKTALLKHEKILDPIAKALENYGRFSRGEYIAADRVQHCDFVTVHTGDLYVSLIAFTVSNRVGIRRSYTIFCTPASICSYL